MPSDLLSLSILALVGSSAALLIGGFSKGSLGLGLPLIAMPIPEKTGHCRSRVWFGVLLPNIGL